MNRTERAQNRYATYGFGRLNRPDIPYPTMDPNISGLTSRDLGNFMAQYAAWREYTEDLLLHAIREYTSLNERLSQKRDRLLIVTSGKNREERLARINQDPDVEADMQLTLEAEMLKDMLAAKLTSIEGSISVISREISRRGNSSV